MAPQDPNRIDRNDGDRLSLLRQLEAAEVRFRALIESGPDAIVAVDRQSCIVLFNAQAEHLFGMARDEAIGQRLDILIPERFRSSHRDLVTDYLSAPKARPMGLGLDLFARRKDGTEFPAEISLSPVQTGDEILIAAAIRDVTERRRVENELRLLQTITQSIGEAEALPMALEQAIQRVCEFTGWSYGEAWLPNAQGGGLERGPAWLAPGRNLEAFARLSEGLVFPPGRGLPGRVWQSRKPEWIRDVSTHPDSLFVRAEAATQAGLKAGLGIPILAEGQVVTVLVFYMRESTAEDKRLVESISAVAAHLGAIIQRKRAEEELAHRVEELARSNAELERFAYVASHDLQEPLRMIASYTQLLARRYKGKLDADADDFIGYAVEGANRMQELIQDLLAYSRVGTRGREFEPTDCEQIFSQTLRSLEPSITEHQATVTHDQLPTIMADGAQIAQVFQNLIGNAVKFHGDEAPRVHVTAKQRDRDWLFSVSDNGIGIEPEYQERIFVIFQRLHGRDKYPGTGIGLAICRKIVERHGGRIWIESQPNQGSTFYFTIPIESGRSSRVTSP